jgi:hypothetical protein
MRSSTRVLLLAGLLSSCAAAPDRPATSSGGCAQAALDEHLPRGLPDKQAHCMAGALISRYCSPAEARLAGIGKELRDAFGNGDVEWADFRATLAGVHCAAMDADMASVVACCENAAPRGTPSGGETR